MRFFAAGRRAERHRVPIPPEDAAPKTIRKRSADIRDYVPV